MFTLPKHAKIINIQDSTTKFYKFEENGSIIYFFDTSELPIPHPMLNAMKGLELLQNDEKLQMLNHKIPLALFPKIENDFKYEVKELEDNYLITFEKKSSKCLETNFKDNNCKG